MPLCMCGHEDHEHAPVVAVNDYCTRCSCERYRERPDYARTTSFTDLPVSQGARDLYERFRWPKEGVAIASVINRRLDILAAADEKDVRSLLWARRTGKL